jgi:hypothetical protein
MTAHIIGMGQENLYKHHGCQRGAGEPMSDVTREGKMTGLELIQRVVTELAKKKIPPTDAAILNFMRNWAGDLNSLR